MTRWCALGVLAATALLAADDRALLDSAIAEAKAGRTQSAIRRFEEVLRGAPPAEIAGQARLELVRIYQRSGRWWDAASQLQELRKLVPHDPEYAYQLGVAYRSLSKAAFERMRAIAPHSARVHQVLGEQYAMAGDPVKAEAAFRQAVAADPKLAGSHLALAVLFLRANRRDEAMIEIGKELQIAPESALARQLWQSIAGAAP